MMLGTALTFYVFSSSISRNSYEKTTSAFVVFEVVFEVASCFAFRERCSQIEFLTGGYPVGLKLSEQVELAIDMPAGEVMILRNLQFDASNNF